MKLVSKIIGSILGVALVATLIYTNVKVLKQLNTATYENTILSEKHRIADSINTVYLAKLKENDSLISKLNKDYLLSKLENEKLDSLLKAKADSVLTVPADSSYSYLNRMIPPVALKIYNFDSVQVKHLHFVYVQNTLRGDLIGGLRLSISRADTLIASKDKQLTYYNLLYGNCQTDLNLYKSEAIKFENKYNNTKIKLDKVKLTRNLTAAGLAVFIVYNGVKLFIKK